MIRKEIPRFSGVCIYFGQCPFHLLSNSDKPAECTFPLTGQRCVSRIITELAVFDVDFTDGLTLVELAEGVTIDEVTSKTEAPFRVADDLKKML